MLPEVLQAAQMRILHSNGVTVRNTGAWTWGGTEQPTATANRNTDVTGLARLVGSFNYGSTNFSVNLSGLMPGRLYDWRIYFRNYATNNRDVTFVFSRNGEEVGRVDWNPDRDENGKGRPYPSVGCRYVADASGTMTVRIISHVVGDKCHLYGFSNELLGDVDGSGEAVSLVKSPGFLASSTQPMGRSVSRLSHRAPTMLL